MRSRIPLILSRAHGALWVMQEPKVYAVFDFLERRAAGRDMTKVEQLAAGIRRQRSGLRAQNGRAAYRMAGSVAVLPIKGVIADHAGMEMDISGGTSTKAFARAFDEALNDPSVSAILFDCDSPGGTVEGVPELAAQIFAARGRKPIEAAVNAHCHSGAYWLASQTDRINITPSGEAGDIGVMTVRPDYSAAAEKAGVKHTLIKAGKYKGEGNPAFAPEEAELDAQRVRVQAMYDLFAADVARGRNVSVKDVENGMGEGRSLGAKLALKAGLVDRIETIEQTLGRLTGRIAPRRGLAANRQPSVEMIAAAVVQQLSAGAGPIEDCPDCGGSMENGAQVCPECGYTAPDPDASDDVRGPASAAAVVTSLSASAGRTVVIAGRSDSELVADAPVLDTPITTQQESKVPDTPSVDLAKITADALAAAKLEAKQRITDITELCALAGVDAAKVNEYLSSDLTAEVVRSQIVAEQKAARAANPNIRVGADRQADRPFDSLGEQLVAIARHNDRNLGEPDKRLYAAVTSGGASANVGSDGAFAIQKEFATDLLESTIEGGDILGQCDSHEVGSNADGLEVVYLDETSRATGSRWGGVQVYRGAEADVPSAKKPKFGKWEVRLEDIIGLAYMTERLLQDAPSIQNVFSNAFMAEFRFVAENEMVRGTGAGQMMGILNAACTVSVAKETGQVADTLVAENIGKMWKCVHPRARKVGAWYYNVELEDQLDQLQIGTGTSAQLVYMPPGGLSGKPYGTIKGRPTIPIEYASGAGDVGDFFFAAWPNYKVITKGGVQSDESIHVGFTKNERTFRWLSRINGAPKLKSSITPFKATDSNLKLSDFVTLAAR
jgi:HK97 family phage major capsid protein